MVLELLFWKDIKVAANVPISHCGVVVVLSCCYCLCRGTCCATNVRLTLKSPFKSPLIRPASVVPPLLETKTSECCSDICRRGRCPRFARSQRLRRICFT